MILEYFNRQWIACPLAVIDTECTGKTPGVDVAVSFGIARFENGQFVGGLERLVNPGRPIDPEATAVHGITDNMVRDVPSIREAFNAPEVSALLKDAQPCAYNAAFDRHFVPPFDYGAPWDWPWLDPLPFVRKLDRYTPGKGAHRLASACARHGISLTAAHSAAADARATGELLFKLGRASLPPLYTLGELIDWCNRCAASEWFRFHGWLSQQPPLPPSPQT